MHDLDDLAQRFEAHRSHLRAVAYRMLGSLAEAEDAVQDTWLRLSRSDISDVANLSGWLTTVVARVCLNHLRSRAQRREASLDVLPEQIVASAQAQGGDPEAEAVLADSVGLALLVVLDTLEPAERLAFVLHDLFAVPFDAISPLIERSPAATRQIASRARRRVSAAGRMPTGDLNRQRAVIDAYLHASRNGDLDALVALLDPDVVLHADAASIPTGVPVVLRGARSVARGAFASTGRIRLTEPALVNGKVGLVMAPLGRLTVALAFTIVGERITAIEVIGDPRRLRSLDLAVLDVE